MLGVNWVYVIHDASRVKRATVQYASGQQMNDSLADILGIIVDGGTVIYVTYKAGRWMLENRDRLIRRRTFPMQTTVDLLRLRVEARPVVELAGTIEVGATMSGELSVTHSKEKPPAWEELLWWYPRVR